MDSTLSGTILFFSTSLSDLARLQQRCASCRLARSLGCPPLLTGMMWSTVGLSGCGYLRVLSTGFPHIPHTSWVLSITLRALSNAALFPGVRSDLRVSISVTNTKGRMTVPLCVLKYFIVRRARRRNCTGEVTMTGMMPGEPRPQRRSKE